MSNATTAATISYTQDQLTSLLAASVTYTAAAEACAQAQALALPILEVSSIAQAPGDWVKNKHPDVQAYLRAIMVRLDAEEALKKAARVISGGAQ